MYETNDSPTHPDLNAERLSDSEERASSEGDKPTSSSADDSSTGHQPESVDTPLSASNHENPEFASTETGPSLSNESSPKDGAYGPDQDLLGGLDVDSSADIDVPDRLIDQVIGQDHAYEVIRKAAEQRRHVMMIGAPGTGKSMLAKAMSELLPEEELRDVLVHHNPDDSTVPKVQTVPAGEGKQTVENHTDKAAKRRRGRAILMGVCLLAVIGYALFVKKPLVGLIAAGVIYLVYHYRSRGDTDKTPNLLIDRTDTETVPFEDATGTHTGALLGDIRHDPFQSGGMETPSHKRVEPGAIHKAHKGVLFIDEINTLDIRTQQKLMTVIQDGEFSITGQSEQSSGAMVETEPLPCDFVMIAAGNLDAMENMHPAFRSRIKGYGYEIHMDNTIEDMPETRRKYARFVAQEVERDENIPHFGRDAIEEIICQAKRQAGRKGHLTLQLRELGGIVRVAGDLARSAGRDKATREDVLEARRRSRSIEQQLAEDHIQRRKDYYRQTLEGVRTGRVNGLAVMSEDSGTLLPVMAEITPAQSGGEVIATGQLEDIAEESVQNVSAIIKKMSDEDLSEIDIHVQFLQTGSQGVDGDSASVTVAAAVISKLKDIPLDQSLAMTGSLSVQGDVLPVNGVTPKIEAAAKAGLDRVIIPAANEQDVIIEDEYKEDVEIVPVTHISEVLDVALIGKDDKETLVTHVENVGEVAEASVAPSPNE